MANNFKNFKGKHPLRFNLLDSPQPTLADMQVGDVFVREGAICMRLNQYASGNLGLGHIPNRVPIINLQSAAVWFAVETDEVRPVAATIVVE